MEPQVGWHAKCAEQCLEFPVDGELRDGTASNERAQRRVATRRERSERGDAFTDRQPNNLIALRARDQLAISDIGMSDAHGRTGAQRAIVAQQHDEAKRGRSRAEQRREIVCADGDRARSGAGHFADRFFEAVRRAVGGEIVEDGAERGERGVARARSVGAVRDRFGCAGDVGNVDFGWRERSSFGEERFCGDGFCGVPAKDWPKELGDAASAFRFFSRELRTRRRCFASNSEAKTADGKLRRTRAPSVSR
jgi:hypothetical protein